MKGSLGKGLSALLGEDHLEKSIEHADYSLKEVDIKFLFPSQYQPRKKFKEDELEELSSSIKHNGVLQPILVRKKSENFYEIIAGERRWRASQKAGLLTVPVVEKDISDEQAFTISLVENIQREDLNPIEEAEAYKKLLEKTSYTQEKLGDLVGKSRTHIANILRLMQLPEIIQDYVRSGKISMGHAKILVGLPDAVEISYLIIQKNLTVRQAEKLIQKLKLAHKNAELEKIAKTPEAEKRKKENLLEALLQSDEEAVRIQNFIQDTMGCKTSVQIKNEGIHISFFLQDMDELDSFMAKINCI